MRFPRLPLTLVVPSSFEECLTYGERQLYMWRYIQELEKRIEELEKKTKDKID